jgi:hypothetical protein
MQHMKDYKTHRKNTKQYKAQYKTQNNTKDTEMKIEHKSHSQVSDLCAVETARRS